MVQMKMDKWNRSDHLVVNSTGSGKWDVVVWYLVTRYSRVFVGCWLVNGPSGFGASH